jgi:uncharacterized repeat protein (TIGR01451 family)
MSVLSHLEVKSAKNLKILIWGIGFILLLFFVLLFTPVPGRAGTSISPGKGADLSIIQMESSDVVPKKGGLSYTLRVHNQGPGPATQVILTDTLPAEVSLSSFIVSQGSCTISNPITCQLGDLEKEASATLTFVVIPSKSGTLTNRVEIGGGEDDPDPSNNQAFQTLTVQVEDEALSLATPVLKN